MPRFPTEETKIIELAQKVASGITNNAAAFRIRRLRPLRLRRI